MNEIRRYDPKVTPPLVTPVPRVERVTITNEHEDETADTPSQGEPDKERLPTEPKEKGPDLPGHGEGVDKFA